MSKELEKAQKLLQEENERKVEAFKEAYFKLCAEHGMELNATAVVQVIPKQ